MDLLINNVKVFILFKDVSSIGNTRFMILYPDILDNMGGLFFDEGHFHDLSQFAGTGVVERHGVFEKGWEDHLLNYI